MWATIGKYLAKGLVWAVGHPDEARALVNTAISTAEAVKQAKAAREK